MGYGSIDVKYTYDNLNRLKTITDSYLNVTEYNYDLHNAENNDMIEKRYANGAVKQSVFDKASRLIELSNQRSNKTIISKYEYALDGLGNRSAEYNTAFTPLNPERKTDSKNYNIANQINNTGFSYDPLGNMTRQPGVEYSYKIDQKLEEVSVGNSKTSYKYDALGNRYEVNRDGVATTYLVDPNTSSVLMKKNNSGTKYFIYGHGLEYSIDSEGNEYYYHYDGTGNTVAITDQDEEIVNLYAYSPYGEVLYSIETVPNSFKYVGKEGVMDDGNGLYYMRARYYDPMLGRFISADPIGHEGGLNLYAYAGNNPVMFVRIGLQVYA